MLKTFSLKTSRRVEFLNVTGQLEKTLAESRVKSGLMTVFVPHTTAGVTINENADPDVVSDMIAYFNKAVPFNDNYAHGEGNSAAHIKSSIFSPSLTLIIDQGEIILGTWQSVYFCEFDGPRMREFYVKVIEG
ncbi:MAG TPA: secondary thiamine-phosphate synthase enzyme YjbQ [Candidatus Wallbacteria bacterium]|nr:secondary thiamine-phosphate synthase enzyme YjbQ [Candidatus Wallbacteria bacterium]